MTSPPSRPSIYHITHVDNLAGILSDGNLISDVRIAERGGPKVVIGYSHIKQRRMRMPVSCHPGTKVAEYVPFYFCPRSVMLYTINVGGRGDLNYRDGQGQILHLEADLRAVVEWADRQGCPWAFTKANAGASYVIDSYSDLTKLDQVDWNSVRANYWSAPDVKEAKQAEFLVHGAFPWELVSCVGVVNMLLLDRVEAAISRAGYNTPVQVRTEWYY